MNYTTYDAFRTASAILVSLGGGGAIVLAMSGWLGKVWADKLMQRNIAVYAQELERLKSTFEAVNKKIQADLDKTIHVYRVQFETEFQALSEIWKRIVAVRSDLTKMRPMIDNVSLDDNKLVQTEKLRRPFEAFRIASGELRMSVQNHRPFYPQNIYDEAITLIDHLSDAEATIQLSDKEPFTANWFRENKENWKAVVNAADRVADMIRNRIENLSLYRD